MEYHRRAMFFDAFCINTEIKDVRKQSQAGI